MVLHKTDDLWQLFWYFNTIEYSWFYRCWIFITSTPKLDIKIMKFQFTWTRCFRGTYFELSKKPKSANFLSLTWMEAPVAKLLMRLTFTQTSQVQILALPKFLFSFLSTNHLPKPELFWLCLPSGQVTMANLIYITLLHVFVASIILKLQWNMYKN